MKIIIGNTGLVGTTLCESVNFELKFNSTNISDFSNIVENGSELYLSCLPATKWLVNKNVKGDFENMIKILNFIKEKKYTKVVLISTIDVYNNSPLKSNESNLPVIESLNYGSNRYLFEVLCRDFLKTDEFKIFRLPALFNKHIKKNILFDLINNNKVDQINCNSTFQWYNLDKLWSDINLYSKEYPEETLFNLFTEPIPTSDIVKMFPQHMDKVQSGPKTTYDYQTKFGGYIDKNYSVLEEIKKFVHEISIK